MTLHEALDEKNKLAPSALVAATHILTGLVLFKSNLKCFFFIFKNKLLLVKNTGGGCFLIMAGTRIIRSMSSFLL